MIRAGTLHEIDVTTGSWVYLDLGFSRKPTCGLIIDDGSAVELSYADAGAAIVQHLQKEHGPISLVIEAPLSVAFDRHGNPTGRACEIHNGQPRYWYIGAGAIVTLAAMYLLARIEPYSHRAEVVLYEGFVSFKKRSSTHGGDAALLREIIETPGLHASKILGPEKLKRNSTDILQGAFEVQGISSGIPPVITVFG